MLSKDGTDSDTREMKKEFGKWFLDLAKYILTAVFLTTYLTKMEGTTLMVLLILFFTGSISIGYVLLSSADKEERALAKQDGEAKHEIKEKNKKHHNKSKR